MVRGEGRRRPRDEQGGLPVPFDTGCLTREQRQLWDEYFADLDQWTEGTICQVALLELWSFDYICMLELGDVPTYPPELETQLRDYGRMLAIYLKNLRAGAKGSDRTEKRRDPLAPSSPRAAKGSCPATPQQPTGRHGANAGTGGGEPCVPKCGPSRGIAR